jgi:hypothetical protein
MDPRAWCDFVWGVDRKLAEHLRCVLLRHDWNICERYVAARQNILRDVMDQQFRIVVQYNIYLADHSNGILAIAR